MKVRWFLFLFYAGLSSGTADLSSRNIALAARYSRQHHGVALRIEQGGRVIFEDYAPGYDAGTMHRIYSGTKNFVALAALYAEQEGLLDLDERASLTLPEWRNDRRRDITLDQLLSQTSGLSPSGVYFRFRARPDEGRRCAFRWSILPVPVFITDPPAIRPSAKS